MKTNTITFCTILTLLLIPIFLTAKTPSQKITIITTHGISFDFVPAIEEEVLEDHSFNPAEVLKEEKLKNNPLTTSTIIDISDLIKEEEEVTEPQLDSLIILDKIQSGLLKAK